MITDTFDNQSPAIINPTVNPNAPRVDACILTFSHQIEAYVLAHYECEQVGVFACATDSRSLYRIRDGEKTFGFCKSYIGEIGRAHV